MDIKRAFDHVSKGHLFTQMMELEIDGNLVTWTGFFLTDQKVQLVINGHNNKKREIETEIPQGSPTSPIFFLIYINKVFNKIAETSLWVTSLSFVDDLGFTTSSSSIKEIVGSLKKVAKKMIEWKKENAVIYDTSKTEAIFFSKSYQQQLSKQL